MMSAKRMSGSANTSESRPAVSANRLTAMSATMTTVTMVRDRLSSRNRPRATKSWAAPEELLAPGRGCGGLSRRCDRND